MIIVDSTELRDNSLFPKLPDVLESSNLEEMTGADFMITPLGMPVSSDTLLKRHIDAGACLVQRKSGNDLISSMGERMDNSLAKMRATSALQAQCVLLFIGTLSISGGGNVIVDGYLSDRHYTSILGAFECWNERGGVVSRIESADQLSDWARLKLSHIEEYKKNPVKYVYPTTAFDLAYQIIEPVRDWRVTIATFPQIGPTRANNLRKAMLNAGAPDDLFTALQWLTHSSYARKTSGIGLVIHKASRAWLGMPDGWDLDIQPQPEDFIPQKGSQE